MARDSFCRVHPASFWLSSASFSLTCMYNQWMKFDTPQSSNWMKTIVSNVKKSLSAFRQKTSSDAVIKKDIGSLKNVFRKLDHLEGWGFLHCASYVLKWLPKVRAKCFHLNIFITTTKVHMHNLSLDLIAFYCLDFHNSNTKKFRTNIDEQQWL